MSEYSFASSSASDVRGGSARRLTAGMSQALLVLLLPLASACGGQADDDVDLSTSDRSAAELRNHASDDMGSLRMGYIRAQQQSAGSAYALRDMDGSLAFDNARQNLSVRFEQDRFELTERFGVADWRLSVAVDGLGCPSVLHRLEASEPTGEGNRIEQRHGALTAWYLNGPLGLEQGFDVPEAPACVAKEGRLTVAMTVQGLQPRLGEAGNVVLEDATGTTVLRVHDLFVTDATGAELSAALVVHQSRLLIDIDASGAVFPVSIDPLWSQQAKLMQSGEETTLDLFGNAVSVSGDTALIGAPDDDFLGSAYVFVRSGTSWTQQQKLTAPDLLGRSEFGDSVSVAGDTALIGAPYDDAVAADSGSAYVFVRSGTSWTQQQKLTASDATGNDRFGNAVSVSGDTTVIGAPDHDDGSTESGAAYVFFRSGTSWTEQQKLTAADAALGDHFGTSASLSGDTAVIGSPDDGDMDSGSAYVFFRSGTSWAEQQKLTASDATPSSGFARSVSASGDTVLIGASFTSDNGTSSGSAYVYVRSGTSWTEQQKLTASDASTSDWFGTSVSVSGGTALIGARYHDDGGTNSGAAYVFFRNGTSWTEQQELIASDAAADDAFGISVSISGDTSLVGAYLDDDGGPDSGSAYVYFRSGTSWTQQQKVSASDADANDGFGTSVSVFGDTALVGALNDDDGGTDSGAAYVFFRNGTSWAQQQKLGASNAAVNDRFGSSVGLSGDTALVGASFHDTVTNTNSGSAYVFVRSGTSWTEQQELTASDAASADAFGVSVSVSGDTALVGANNDDDAGFGSGSAYVLFRSGTSWAEQQKLTASDAAVSDYFGSAVSVSGDTALVGAYGDDDGGLWSGSAYVFLRSGTSWAEQQKLTASDAAEGDQFGRSVSVSGNTAIVGAHLDSDAGTNSGSAYVYFRSGTSWAEQQKLTAADAAAIDNFGIAVSVSGDTALVGAYQDDDGGSGSGSAYVFLRSGTSWAEQQKLTAADAASGDNFGNAVSVSGETALVGAVRDDTFHTDNGSAYAFIVAAAVDGTPCTLDVDCQSGFCRDGVCCNTGCGGGQTSDCQACSTAAGAAVDGSCGPSTGNTCDDGNACTQTDTCQSGTCTGGSPVTCAAQDECHDVGSCDTGTGSCSNPAKPDGTICSGGTCQGGSCQPSGTGGTAGSGGTAGVGGTAASGGTGGTAGSGGAAATGGAGGSGATGGTSTGGAATGGTSGATGGDRGGNSPSSSDEGGCGCRTAGGERETNAAWLLFVLGIASARRRRATPARPDHASSGSEGFS